MLSSSEAVNINLQIQQWHQHVLAEGLGELSKQESICGLSAAETSTCILKGTGLAIIAGSCDNQQHGHTRAREERQLHSGLPEID